MQVDSSSDTGETVDVHMDLIETSAFVSGLGNASPHVGRCSSSGRCLTATGVTSSKIVIKRVPSNHITRSRSASCLPSWLHDWSLAALDPGGGVSAVQTHNLTQPTLMSCFGVAVPAGTAWHRSPHPDVWSTNDSIHIHRQFGPPTEATTCRTAARCAAETPARADIFLSLREESASETDRPDAVGRW